MHCCTRSRAGHSGAAWELWLGEASSRAAWRHAGDGTHLCPGLHRGPAPHLVELHHLVGGVAGKEQVVARLDGPRKTHEERRVYAPAGGRGGGKIWTTCLGAPKSAGWASAGRQGPWSRAALRTLPGAAPCQRCRTCSPAGASWRRSHGSSHVPRDALRRLGQCVGEALHQHGERKGLGEALPGQPGCGCGGDVPRCQPGFAEPSRSACRQPPSGADVASRRNWVEVVEAVVVVAVVAVLVV